MAMTTEHLIESLAAEIRAATANLKLPVEYYDEQQRRQETTWREVNVYEQYIPKDLFESDEYYPCVTVELLEVRDDLKQGSTATVALMCGTYAKEANGWKDAFRLMEVIRDRLLTRRTLAHRYRLAGECIWQVVPNQPAPFYFLYGEVIYETFMPQETTEGYI